MRSGFVALPLEGTMKKPPTFFGTHFATMAPIFHDKEPPGEGDLDISLAQPALFCIKSFLCFTFSACLP